jgi:hypothetical protein
MEPAAKALAGAGRSRPTRHQRRLRCVGGRPVRAVPWLFLAWLTTSLAAQGTRALVGMEDHASWHLSQEVRQWRRSHQRTVKAGGGGRWLMGRFPSKSPWVNPIEPQGVHGKRAVSEPVRPRAVAALRQRMCAYDHWALEDFLV